MKEGCSNDDIVVFVTEQCGLHPDVSQSLQKTH